VWVVKATARPLYPRERDPVPILWEAWWAPGQVWTCAKSLAPTGIRSPGRPALASRYTDWAIPVHRRNLESCMFWSLRFKTGDNYVSRDHMSFTAYRSNNSARTVKSKKQSGRWYQKGTNNSDEKFLLEERPQGGDVQIIMRIHALARRQTDVLAVSSLWTRT
jgi:hypothetical protein